MITKSHAKKSKSHQTPGQNPPPGQITRRSDSASSRDSPSRAVLGEIRVLIGFCQVFYVARFKPQLLI